MENYADSIIIAVVLTTVLVLLLASFILILFFLHQRKQILHFNSISQLRLEHEKNILKTQLEIQESTFEDISQEIHDNIGLSLTLAKLNLNTIESNKTFNFFPLVDSAKELISKAIRDLNDLSKSLKAERVVSLGLYKSVELEVEKIKNIGIFEIEYAVFGEPFFLDPAKEVYLYRVFQESLNNILKHASANIIKVKLDYDQSGFSMYISDNGVGFNINEINAKQALKSMAGLNNIYKRVELMDGKCEIHSEKRLGTTIKIIIPKQFNDEGLFS